MSEYLSIGRILNFHGIKGEAKIGYTKGKELQLKSLSHMIIEKDGRKITLTPESVRFHKQHAIIKFKEINSIEEVQELKNIELKAKKEEVQKYLEEDEFLIGDLVGLKAYNTQEEELGKVTSVLVQPSGELLVIEDKNKKKHLVPFAKELVPTVNLQEQTIIINEIEGLFE